MALWALPGATSSAMHKTAYANHPQRAHTAYTYVRATLQSLKTRVTPHVTDWWWCVWVCVSMLDGVCGFCICVCVKYFHLNMRWWLRSSTAPLGAMHGSVKVCMLVAHAVAAQAAAVHFAVAFEWFLWLPRWSYMVQDIWRGGTEFRIRGGCGSTRCCA